MRARRQRQPVRPLHLHRPHAVRARLLRRRARRHVDLGLGPQLPDVAQRRRRLDEGAQLVARQRGPRVVGARQSPTASRIRSARTAWRRSASRACPPDPLVAGGIVGVDITGHIRLGSPNFMPKFQHTDQMQYLDTLTVAQGQPPVEVRRRHHGADEQRATSTFRRRAAISASPASSPATPFADFLLGYARQAELSNVHVVNQRRWSHGLLRPGRLACRPIG